MQHFLQLVFSPLDGNMEVHIGIIMSASILRVARKLSKDVMSQEYPRFEMRFFMLKEVAMYTS
jgi:hypothetical protein